MSGRVFTIEFNGGDDDYIIAVMEAIEHILNLCVVETIITEVDGNS